MEIWALNYFKDILWQFHLMFKNNTRKKQQCITNNIFLMHEYCGNNYKYKLFPCSCDMQLDFARGNYKMLNTF